ncbi:vanadium-dependent haloperoxidase, partial [Roseibium sp. RKSG952]|uniref:vanadium-dependent haloperoxidase n=1 Tax=Roseibium sp. RKSG952 TaxID=2529384 RepID=UPI0018AD17EB
ANLTDEEKVISEFWEDGAGTSLPPGTFMTFAQYVSARDDNSQADDVELFLAMSNGQLDASIAAWDAKADFDYARPVRAIRDLGELGLIGEEGVDEVTGESGYVIEAYTRDENGNSTGTQTILAENFITYQLPSGEPSPAFAEYVSGHSTFGAAGAAVLEQFTGSDEFGASFLFEAGNATFENGGPSTDVLLEWDTFSQAAEENGVSRLYGGVHWEDGNTYGLELGDEVGLAAYEQTQAFLDGTATDEDRPFFGDDLIA